MYPMLRDRRDTIMIRPVEGRLKKYDVPLYRRGYRRGEAYVLHRIVKVLPDSYVICGDNCFKKEYGIREEQILGVLDRLLSEVPVYELCCDISHEAVKVSFEALTGTKIKE